MHALPGPPPTLPRRPSPTRGTAGDAEVGVGDPVRDPVLRGAILDVVGRVDRALGLPRQGATAAAVDAASARGELAARLVRLAEELRRPRDADRWSTTRDQLVDLLLDVRRIAERLEAEIHREATATLHRIHSAVALVRRASSLEQLVEDAPGAAIALGFRRALVSSVREGVFLPEHAVDGDDPEAGTRLVRAGRDAAVPLDRGLRESDMVRSRVPIVVPDVGRDPRVHDAFARAGWRSYVAAPVTLHDEVVGFVHADRGEGPVGARDADVLQAFADALGQAHERLAAVRRADEARVRVRRALEDLDGVLVPGGHDAEDGGFGPSAPGPRADVGRVLTSREREVLRLMAAGATNAAIAASLVIAEGTAKTHVKNILRKLEAGNRAEAVSLFLGGVVDEADAPA